MDKFIPGQILFAIPGLCTEHTEPQVVTYQSGDQRVVCDYRGTRLVLDRSDCFPLADDAWWEVKRRMAANAAVQVSEDDFEVSFAGLMAS